MAMLRYGTAAIAEPCVSPDAWEKKVVASCPDGVCRMKVARSVIAKYSPEKYLLSHVSIMAAVDTDLANPSDPKSNYLIKPEFAKFVNNNGDAWTKAMLAASYRTFIGANNFLEHVQIPSLSKGKVVDAVLREVPIGKDKQGKDLTTYYVDLLVATDRKHRELVADIESSKLTTLSMGCFLEGTEITMADGRKVRIEDIRQGDLVLTHTGKIRPVTHTQKRWYEGLIHVIKSEGNYKPLYATPEHPFWSFSKRRLCACGCGQEVDITVRGDKTEDGIPAYSMYKIGHYARVVNPNSKTYSLNDYRDRKENNPIKDKVKLSWNEANTLREGDLVSYPVSDVYINDPDATIEKARLIGYFLAEGSFVKEVIVQGEENDDYAVRCHVCGNLYNKITTHLSAHGMTTEEYVHRFPGAKLNAHHNKSLIRASRKKAVDINGLLKSRKNIGAEFSLGQHEYDTVNKEIADLSAKVFPNAIVLRYPKCIKIMGEDVAAFFLKHCGQYFDDKTISQEVVLWPVEIQKHLIATWIIGDYTTTGSKNLANQLRFMMYRCGIRHNLYYVESKAYKTDVSKKTADGTVVTKHYEGTRSESYLIQWNMLALEALKSELSYAFEYKTPKRYKKSTELGHTRVLNGWKNTNVDNSILRPIQKIDVIPFSGWVYNFGVAEESSFVANDVAVHNCKIAFSVCTKCGNKAYDDTQLCQCVKYEKGNNFIDKMGVTRKVAELCGDASEPESVIFIDASWVRNPAFTGAVRRNTVAPTADIMAKIEAAHKKKAYEVKEGDLLRAASIRFGLAKTSAEEDPYAEPPPPDAPAEEPPADAPADVLPADAPPTDAPADAPPADAPPEEAPPAEPMPPAEPANPIKDWKNKVKEKLLEELGNEIMNEFSGTEEGPTGPRPLETLDESLIQPAASTTIKRTIVNARQWDNYLTKTYSHMDKKALDKIRFGTYMVMSTRDPYVLKDYGYNGRDFLAVLSVLDSCFPNAMSNQVKKAMARVSSVDQVKVKIGRDLTDGERKKVAAWLKAVEKYQN